VPASRGEVRVDGAALAGAHLTAVRRHTALVDPAVFLWNRSVLANLLYGSRAPAVPLASAVEAAELGRLIADLPDGMRTGLGEGGALVSGGEGQRVRFGRALLRERPRLVLLDEPFRGLDRPLRCALLERARQWWHDATLLCVTHDVSETLAFERVLVVEAGTIVEDGEPRELARDRSSRYAALLRAERRAGHDIFRGASWRRIRLDRGELGDDSPDEREERTDVRGIVGAG
jgi:ATP-binding cassette subfamily B protein